MAAAAYRSQIADLLARLANNTAAAREWRTVADNRLALIVVMDSAIAAMYSMMLATESQTSLRAPTTEVPLGDPSIHSADEACRFALERLRCCALYLGSLRRETAALQSVLLETLNDGLQLLSVPRPIADLQVSEYPGMGESIHEVSSEAPAEEEGCPDSASNTRLSATSSMDNSGSELSTPAISTALALFIAD